MGRTLDRASAQASITATEPATDQLVAEFRQSNRNMGVIRYHEGIRVEGLLFVVFFQSYENLFQQMLHSVRINR